MYGFSIVYFSLLNQYLSVASWAKLYIIFLIIVCDLYFQHFDISIAAGAWSFVSEFLVSSYIVIAVLFLSPVSMQRLCTLRIDFHYFLSVFVQ